MKKSSIYLTLLFTTLAVSTAKAQGLEVGIKGGFVLAPSYFRGEHFEFDISRNDPATGYSGVLQASMPVGKHLRFGLETGITKFNSYTVTNIKFTEATNYNVTEAGHYEVKQYNIMGVAEYRFGKKNGYFANIGAGYCKDQKSEFTDGTRYVYDNGNISTLDMTGWTYNRNNSVAAFIGGGVCPKITKHLSLLGEFRYTLLPSSFNLGPDYILLNFHVLNFNLGIVYRFSEQGA